MLCLWKDDAILEKKKSKSSFLLSILREFLFLAIFSILEAFAKP